MWVPPWERHKTPYFLIWCKPCISTLSADPILSRGDLLGLPHLPSFFCGSTCTAVWLDEKMGGGNWCFIKRIPSALWRSSWDALDWQGWQDWQEGKSITGSPCIKACAEQ